MKPKENYTFNGSHNITYFHNIRHSCVLNQHNIILYIETNQWQLVAHLIGWAHQYINKIMNPPKIINISECSAQGQVFHCKLKYQGCSYAQRQVFNSKLRNQGCSFTRMRSEKWLQISTCSSVWKRGKIHLLSPSKMLKEREKYMRASPRSHTQKFNPILVHEQIYVQYSCSWPLHHIFQMGALLARPTVARDGESIYLAMKMYWCSSR